MVESMDELMAQVQGQLYRLQDLHEATNGIRVEETSPDGAVTVVVDGTGALVGLNFSEAIRELGPTEFEQILVRTAHAALYGAYAARGALVTSFNGAGT